MRWFLTSLMTLLILIPMARPLQAQQTPCDLDEGYLETLFDDLLRIDEERTALDVADPAAVSLFYVELYQLRHRYENMTPTLPECGLRGHTMFLGIISNWQDTVGLVLATQANPDAMDQYIAEIDVIQQRIEFFTPLLLEEFYPPSPPTPTVPPATEAPVLSVFYVATEGLNVRNGPGPEFDAIGVLTGGNPIEVISLDTLPNGDVWYEINYEDGENGTGWVYGPLISVDVPPEFPEPLPPFDPDAATATANAPTPTPRPTNAPQATEEP